MRAKYIVFLIAVISLATVFYACDEEENSIPQVSVCLKPLAGSWQQALRTHAVNNLEAYGLAYSISNADQEITQSFKINEQVELKTKVFIVSPNGNFENLEAIEEETEQKKIVAELNAAANAGIPLIFLESAPIATYSTLIEINNTMTGELAAGFFNNQQNITKIAVLNVKQDLKTSNTRNEGLKSKLNPGLETVTIEIDNYNTTSGTALIRDILNNYKDINAIYAQDDEIAKGILASIGESDQIKAIVGCGGSESFATQIKSTLNINMATTIYSPKELMDAATTEANEILKSNTPPVNKLISIDTQLVDKTNVEQYLQNPAY